MMLPPEIQAVLDGRERWAVVCADFREIAGSLPSLSIDHGIHDPPYSEHVHGKQRRMLRGSGGRTAAGQRSGRGQVGPAELGFAALTPEERRAAAELSARVVKRWSLFFSDAESNSDWRSDLVAAGVEHVRAGAWIKVNGQPQLTGDRPAVGFEAIEIAHQSIRKGRMRWNSGGHSAVWAHAIATDRNATGDRIHTTQKPLPLMLELIEDFCDHGELILDCFAGSGTTGVAAVRLGCRFIGIERDPEHAKNARERLEAETHGQSLRSFRAKQTSIFDLCGAPRPHDPAPKVPTGPEERNRNQ